MTTTITLTPTLTLSVADRRMPQPSIEAVWAAIAQHTRATGRASTIAVLDGAEQLRLWQLNADGARAQLERQPGSTTEIADFRLLLSPWMMSVPRETGPEIHEVSTLTVARAQASEAATAGDVDLILQTAGTDEDTAETISPIGPEAITATQEPEEEEDLFDELADDEDVTPDEATRRFRRRAIIGGSALALFLGVSMTAAGWTMFAGPGPSATTAAPTPAPTATDEPTATDPSTAAPVRSEALPPAGFSGTPTWEVVGATDQSSGLSWTGKEAAAVSGRTLDIVDTDSGDLLESETLPRTPEAGPYPLASTTDEGGILLPGEDSVMTWSPEAGLKDTELPEDHRLVVRGTTVFTVPHNDDTRPDAIQLVTPEGLEEITSPGNSAAPIGMSQDDGFLWASSTDGGTLIRASDSGEVEDSTRLIGPSSGTTISQWLGATDDYAAAIWANDGSGSILTIHDAETGKVVKTQELGSSSSAGLRIVPTHDDSHLLVGSTPINLSTGSIADPVEDLSSTNRSVRAVPGGWLAASSEGTPLLISPEGEVQSSPSEAEALLGIADSGDLVVDHRGALAAFTPAPDTEGEN